MNKPQFLDPTEIHQFHEGYPGPYMIGYEHLKRIFTGWKDPGLTEELERLRGHGRLNYWGMMDPEETNVLVGIIKATEPDTIFEFGTGLGMLTKYMAEAAQKHTKVHTLDVLPSQLDRTVIPVDLWNRTYVQHQDEDVGKAYRDAGLEGKVIQHLGDSATFDFSTFKGKINVVVVDANHAYKAAKNDLSRALEIVSPGGIVVVDDYGKLFHSSGVVHAVHKEVYENGRVFYHVNLIGEMSNRNILKTGLIFHPNIPEAIRKNGG